MKSPLVALAIWLGFLAASASVSAETPATATVEINGESPQRSSVESVRIRFSSDVGPFLLKDHLRLKNLTTGEWVDSAWLAMQYDASSHLATWTFPGAPAQTLPQANYLAALSASAFVAPIPNRTLDTPGLSLLDQAFGFFRFYGDRDGDRDVDFLDTAFFRKTWNLPSTSADYDVTFDVDRDGSIGAPEEAAYKANYFTIFPAASGVYASLFNDTGLSPTDGLTADPTIAGTLLRKNATTALRATLAPAGSQTPPAPVNLAADLAPDGTFRLSPARLAEIASLPVNSGSWRLLLETVDSGAVSSSHEVAFSFGDSACELTQAAGWTTTVSSPSGTANPLPGSVVFANCEALLTEGDSFAVTLERTFTLPAAPGLLAITYEAPSFDTTTSGSMRDTFEAALVDGLGNPLVFSIQGGAGVSPASSINPLTLPPSPDAFFNHTDQKSPFAAPGSAVEVSGSGRLTVSCDVSQLSPGSSARLILRLVNNDRDHASTVRITGVEFKPTNPALDLTGSPPTALSPLTEEGAFASVTTATTETVGNPGNSGPKIVTGTSSMIGGSNSPTLVTDPNDPRFWQGATVGTFAQLYFGADTVGNRQKVIENQLLDAGLFNVSNTFPATMIPTPYALGTGGSGTYRGYPAIEWSDTTGTGDFNNALRNDISGFTAANSIDTFGIVTSDTLGDSIWDLGTPSQRAAIFPSIDHGPFPQEAIESTAYLSNDRINWTQAVVQRVWLEGWQPNLGIKWDGFVYAVGTASNQAFRYVSIIIGGPGALQNDGDDEINGVLGLNADFNPTIHVASPTVAIVSPGDNSQKISSNSVLLSGYAMPDRPEISPGVLAANNIVLVTINGRPVDALDAAGNFFSAIEIKPGKNTFEVTATDTYDLTTKNTITVYGVSIPENTSSLSVASSGIQPDYGRTSFNEATRTLYADLALRNDGTYPINGPFYVGVRQISDPSVHLLGADGVTADGLSFYDFSATLTGGKLAPGVLSASRAIAFYNPNHVQFTYELVVLGQSNQEPYFTTSPPLEAVPARAYSYPAQATDPDGDTLTYSLLQGPTGLTIAPATGLVSWTPTANQLGTHDVHIGVNDGKGGIGEQRFTVIVITAPTNRPPFYTSAPVTVARTGSRYNYDANALDPDKDILRYSLLNGPKGMIVDSASGEVQWQVPDAYATKDSTEVSTVDLSAPANFKLADLAATTASNFPTGSILVGDVPFFVPAIGTNAWHSDIAPGQNPRQLDIPINKSGVTKVRTLMNTYWGQRGPGSSTKIEFFGTNGAYHAKELIGDVDIRDYVQNTWTNVINGTSTVNAFTGIADKTDNREVRLDMQTFNLPTVFSTETLESIRVSDTGATEIQRIFVAGVTIESLVSNPTDDVSVAIRAEDGRGGVATQSYKICVLAAEGNRSPIITSCPVEKFIAPAEGEPAKQYQYSVSALDGDGDALAYKLLSGPQGMVIDSATGRLTWTVSTLQIGPHSVNLEVADNRGGVDKQTFVVMIQPAGTSSIEGVVFNDLNLNGVADSRLPVGNGDFSLGNTAFTNEYSYQSNLNPEGTYYIGPNPRLYHGSFSSFGDHTTGDGPMMIVNGATSGNSVVWQQNIPVLPNSNYRFSAWVASAFPDAPANLQFFANDVQIGTNFVLPIATGEWIELFANWNSGNSQSVKLQIRNFQGAFGGNDFTLDDIGFGLAEPGLPDWIVYNDENGNGRRDSCEQYTTTSPSGSYSFTGLSAGNYRLGVETQPGWIQTSPVDHFYSIALVDGQKISRQDFGVYQTNNSGNVDPYFLSTPLTNLSGNQAYVYQSIASDPDGDAITYGLVNSPAGMIVEASTGALGWRPSVSQIGTHDVTLRVQDGRGGVALQNWTITVTAPNSAPVFTTLPPGPAVVDKPYRYVVRSQDADGLPLVFSLATGAPSGMALNSQFTTSDSTVLEWTPPVARIGQNPVEIIARDSDGLETRQSFDLQVVASAQNTSPLFTNTPRTQVRTGLTYLYLATASDADGDPLTFELATAPDGMAFDNSQPSTPNSQLIRWTPSATQSGDHPVTLRVKDGRGGDVDQSFTITVGSTLENQAPEIVSNPPLNATDDQLYEYDLVADDPDGDDITWRLVSGPVGMSLNPATGALRWIPTQEQLGNNAVMVEAVDTLQATATQSWTIDVGCVNRPPAITSTPPVTAQTGAPYLYAPRGTDRDGDILTWSLQAAPTGMTINAATGLIRWTPAANQTGPTVVTLRASDGRGGTDTQTYTLNTGDLRANRLPVIVSTPSLGITAGGLYRYNVRATDADGDLITLQLLTKPTGATLTPTSSVGGQVEGSVEWTPAIGLTGPQEFIVVATDPLGGSASQRFMVTVRANQPPVITSTAPLAGVPTVTYRYDVRATDPNGDALRYSLDQAPSGMTIDTLGRIAWLPVIAQVGSHPVTVKVSDGYGAEATQNFTVVVAADMENPTVGLIVSYNLQDGNGGQYVRVGSQVPLRVTATDNVGVTFRSLTLNGSPVPLNADGSGVANFPVTGNVQAVAVARDASGNSAQFTTSIAVVDPNAASTVAIVIHSPASETMVTGPVDVVASITSQVDLASYRLEVAELTSDASSGLSVGDPSFVFQTIANVTLPPGTRNLANTVLGKFDPTLLHNGSYLLRVTALDTNQKGRQEGSVVHVTGNLKLGEFRLEFTDLTVPLVGIPIEIKRVYDSRDSQRKGDFGCGWTLGLQNARIQEIGKVPFSGFGDEGSTFTTRSRVYLTAPDGRRIGFKFVPRLAASGFFQAFYSPSFVADPGVYDKLESIPADAGYQVSSDGSFVGGFGLVGFDPSGYRLTTRENLVYEYDQNFGLKKVTDLNGNTVSFTTGGIRHSGGAEIRFTRDAQGRITKITDPSGKEIVYAYDTQGDLITSTDRTALATQYRYHTTRAHYLDEIIDPLGRRAVKTEYGPDGRVAAVIDALGNRQEQSFDLDQFTGTRTDARGNVTELTYNERGNVTQEKDPEGGIRKFEYNDPANPDKETKITDPNNHSTIFAYDARGNLTRQTDANGKATVVTYTALDKPATVTNALGQKVTLRYDASGQLDRVTDNAGNHRHMARDSQGRVASIMDAEGHPTQFDYTTGCPCGRPGKVINPDGSFRLYEYNALGQVTKETDETGIFTLSSYDNEGKLLFTEDMEGKRTRYTYRGALQETVTNPLGHVTRTEYDDNNRPIKITDAEGGIVRFEYDADGNRTKVIDPVGNVTTFVYDKTGRLEEEINTLGHKRVHSYDLAGNRTETIDRNGRRRTFEFDALNRMTKEKWWDGANTIRTLEYAFNDLGLQTLAADPAARYDSTYDTLNRLKTVKSTVPSLPDFILTYAYDKNGQTTSVTDNYGVSVGSEYDARSRLAKRIWQGTGVDPTRVDFTYDNAGRRTRLDRFIDLAGTQRVGHTDNAYNPLGLLRSITHKGPTDNVLSSHVYTYDDANRITDWIIDGQNSSYTYDKTAQLLTADYASQPDEAYTYDKNGNRTLPGYVTGPDNQLLADGVHTYTYDNEGNRVTRTHTLTGKLTTYEYDLRNRLISITDQDGDIVEKIWRFSHDATNRRLSESVNGTKINFLHNREDTWADVDNFGVVIDRYLSSNRIDEFIANQRNEGERDWYILDHLGTARHIAGHQGAIKSTKSFGAFGPEDLTSDILPINRIGFTGREQISGTDLNYYRSRILSTQTGRYTTIDPISMCGGDGNLYRYVSNSPTIFRDPSGKIALAGYAAVLLYANAVIQAATNCKEMAGAASQPQDYPGQGNYNTERDFMRHCTWLCCTNRAGGLLLAPAVWFTLGPLFEAIYEGKENVFGEDGISGPRLAVFDILGSDVAGIFASFIPTECPSACGKIWSNIGN